jgi:hypothetical protein
VNDDITADNYRRGAANGGVSRIPIANGEHAWPTSNVHLTCLSASAVTSAFFSKHAGTTH